MSAANHTAPHPKGGNRITGKFVDYTSSCDSDYIFDNGDACPTASMHSESSSLTATPSQSQLGEDRRRPSYSGCSKISLLSSVSHERINQRSNSMTMLSRPVLKEQMTADSGMDDSVDVSFAGADEFAYLPTTIYGEKGVVAIIENRFAFDQNKIDEYIGRKKRFRRLAQTKSAQSTDPSVVSGGSSKKLSSFVSGLFKSSKRPEVPAEPAYQPIFRHHSSVSTRSDKQ